MSSKENHELKGVSLEILVKFIHMVKEEGLVNEFQDDCDYLNIKIGPTYITVEKELA